MTNRTCKGEPAPASKDDLPADLRTLPAELLAALEASVKLQSHYAAQLNDYDGGGRMTFPSAGDWIRRLRECRRQEADRRKRAEDEAAAEARAALLRKLKGG